MSLPVIFGVGAALLLGAYALSDRPSPAAYGGGAPLPDPVPDDVLDVPLLAASLTCEDAIAQLPAAVRPSVTAALATSANADALDALALSLEGGAGAPGLMPIARAALLRAAQCLRDRAAAIRLASLGSSSPGLSISSRAREEALRFDQRTGEPVLSYDGTNRMRSEMLDTR